MNAINVIKPYRWEGMWVFDDSAVGLVKEPFVSGADDMMDLLAAGMEGAPDEFRLIFAGTPFPRASHTLVWRREEHGGNWYFSPEFEMEGWLCPALLKYFESAPPEIHLKAEVIETKVGGENDGGT